MAMLALVSETPIASFDIEEQSFRSQPPIMSFFDLEDEMDLNFMDTFDQTVTHGSLEWGQWSRSNQVEERVLRGKEASMLATLHRTPAYRFW